MRSFPVLLVLFLLVPLVEIYILIKVGGLIGAIPTVFMVVFTAVLGALLLQAQGFATLQRVRATLERGEVPAIEMMEGVVLLVGGALLLTPGFFTDAIGFLCLITPLRRALVVRFLRRATVAHGRGGDHEKPRGPVTLEGDYRREDKDRQ